MAHSFVTWPIKYELHIILCQTDDRSGPSIADMHNLHHRAEMTEWIEA